MFIRNTRMCTISCIIPEYNAYNYITRAIDCLIHQSYTKWEAIIVDDASDYKTYNMILQYVKKDDRFKVVRNNKNLGAGYSRNVGINISSGEFIIFLDADDEYDNNMLEEAYNCCISENADVTIFGYEQHYSDSLNDNNIGKKRVIIPTYKVIEEKDLTLNDIIESETVIWNKMIRKKVIVDNELRFQEIPTNNDVFFSMACVRTADRIVFLNKNLYKYTYGRNDSLTNKRLYKKENIIDAYLEFFHFMARHNDRMMIEYLNYMLDYFQGVFASNRSDDIKRDLRRQFLNDKSIISVLSDKLIIAQLYDHNKEYVYHIMNKDFIISNRYECYMKRVLEIRGKYKKLALWGCGMLGKEFLIETNKQGIYLDYIVDEMVDKQGKYFEGYRISKYEDIENEIDAIIVLNWRYEEAIRTKAKGKQIITTREL